jgi:hypothetical protein
MQRFRLIVAAAVMVAIVMMAPGVSAADTLAAAKDLYASAAYDEALAVLNKLLAGVPARDERREIELYRTLCLVAIGRSAEADKAIEAMVTRDPLFRPLGEDIPPRMRIAFSDTRKRLLPALVQQKYADAKEAFDRKDFAGAASGFKATLDGLADPDIAEAAKQSPLSDLRVLAVGFLDLSEKSMAPPPLPPAFSPAPNPAPTAVPRATPRVPTPVRQVYTSEDRNVVLPTTVHQAVPPFQGRISVPMTGVVEVVIDETGAVESVAMRETLTPPYDRLIVSAARTWKYRPATVNGMPVKFRKLVQINLVPSAR